MAKTNKISISFAGANLVCAKCSVAGAPTIGASVAAIVSSAISNGWNPIDSQWIGKKASRNA